MKLELSCSLCQEDAEVEFDAPAGWILTYGESCEEDAFCPAHASVGEWRSAQCPGCVGGWRDCPLWDAFAYSGKRTITDDDLAVIERGRCPKRVNGSFMMSGRGMEAMDISETAPTESGTVLAQAIRDYIDRWPDT